MGDDKENPADRTTAPKGPEEWRFIWRGAERANRAGPIIDPIYAVVSNWRAIAIVVIVILWLNKPEILTALQTIFGVKE